MLADEEIRNILKDLNNSFDESVNMVLELEFPKEDFSIKINFEYTFIIVYNDKNVYEKVDMKDYEGNILDFYFDFVKRFILYKKFEMLL